MASPRPLSRGAPSQAAPDAPDTAASVPSAGHVVSPLHVLLLGGAALGSGAAITASLAYKEAGRRLRADGIDPRARRAVLPLALRAAAGSLAMTAAFAAGGFWLLRELGAVEDAPAALPSAGEAWAVLRGGGAAAPTGEGGSGGSSKMAGDGSTLRALSAAWQRRQGSGFSAEQQAEDKQQQQQQQEQQQQEPQDTSKRREQQRQEEATPPPPSSSWWWWRRREQ